MEWSKKVYNKIRTPFVLASVKLNITANQITYFNHFITLTFGVYFFSRGTYIGGLLGLSVMLINGFLDYLDGDVAKATKQYSKFGEWIDSGFDVVIQNVIMGAIAIGCFREGLYLVWIILFFIANSGSNLVSFHYNYQFGFHSAQGNELFRNYMNKKPTLINRFFKNLIDPTASFIGLFFFTFRYFIVIGIIFGILPVCFIVMTLISNFRWFVMFVLYALHLKEWKYLHVLRALAILDDQRKEFYDVRSV